MIKLTDPDHFQEVQKFCEISLQKLDNCEQLLDGFENTNETSYLEKFSSENQSLLDLSQKFEVLYIPALFNLGQKISIQSSQVNDEELLNVVSAVLYDLVDVLKTLFNEIKNNQNEDISDINLDALKSRFVWINEKLQDYQISTNPAKIIYEVDMSELYEIFKMDYSDSGH